MKAILIFMVLAVPGYGGQNGRAIIWEEAHKKWPDNKEMREHVIKEQREALTWMRARTPDKELVRIAEAKWPRDFVMQKHAYKEQRGAKQFMDKRGLDAGLKSAAEKRWPQDYEMQVYLYERLEARGVEIPTPKTEAAKAVESREEALIEQRRKAEERMRSGASNRVAPRGASRGSIEERKNQFPPGVSGEHEQNKGEERVELTLEAAVLLAKMKATLMQEAESIYGVIDDIIENGADGELKDLSYYGVRKKLEKGMQKIAPEIRASKIMWEKLADDLAEVYDVDQDEMKFILDHRREAHNALLSGFRIRVHIANGTRNVDPDTVWDAVKKRIEEPVFILSDEQNKAILEMTPEKWEEVRVNAEANEGGS